MRLSKSFVSEYIDIHDIDYHELAEKMVFAGNEYESIEPISAATNLVVGYVKSCKMHPESKKLHICEVDLGDEVQQIICGAPNVDAGQKVIVAKIGATLPGGIEIKKAKLAGLDSNGMICSLAELGLESKYVTEEDKAGIHVLPDDAIVGSDALAYLGFDDEAIDFELTSNRADLLSVLGMAYEIGAIYNRPVKLPIIDSKESKEDINDHYRLEVKTENAPIYLGKLVKNVVIKESPRWMKARLMASGIRPINNVVDISNYVMLEYGQPLHFFDADRLGHHVIVRDAKEGEHVTTLDGQDRILNDTDIVIANDKEVVALAGVMGGLSTEVEMDTKNIFIESAIFDSYHIRHTSKRILKSEASNRYEKGIDPNRTELALKRACYLLQEYASGEVTGGILTHDKAHHENKEIDVTLSKINQVLGMNLTIDIVCDVFERLGFETTVNGENLHVVVPTRRLDIEIAEDLIEEVGRIYGYDHVEGHMPIVSIKRGEISPKQRMEKELRRRLEGMGLSQVITYSLVSEKEANLFTDKETDDVVLLEPMSDDKKVMRKSILPSLLKVWEYNVARKQNDIMIFEAGSVYTKEDGYHEEAKIAGLLYGTYFSNDWQQLRVKVDFYLLKGIIENILKYLGLNNRYQFKTTPILKELHPGRSCAVLVDNDVIGYLGQVHPSINKKEIYVFELSIDKLLSKKVRIIKFKETPKYPSIHKDLAFVMPKDMTSETVMNILKRVGGRYLSDLDVFDVYVGENVLENEKSVAYSLTFQDPTKTLTDEEVMTIFNKMIREVETKTGARLRDK